jgi:predicted transposase YbfD/YdcC
LTLTLKVLKKISDHKKDELVKTFKLDQQKNELTLTIDIIENEYRVVVKYAKEGKNGKYLIKTTKGQTVTEKIDTFTSIENCLNFILDHATEEREKYLEMVNRKIILKKVFWGIYTNWGNS